MTSSTLTKQHRLNAPELHHLPNGLTIVAEQMPIDVINLNLWLNVGSYLEPDPINGMAHFLEHMIFKGTERLPSGEFERRIEQRGAVINAATSQDYTHYYLTCAPSHFKELAPLQIDMVLNPLIPDDAFERERLVVIEEIRRSQDNPRRRMFGHMMELGFEVSPYRRQVLGLQEVISQLQPQQMRDFHSYWYQPKSITAVVVGNLPVEELIDTVALGFGNTKGEHPKKNNKYPTKNYIETPFTEVVRRSYTDKSLQQARLAMIWRVPGLKDLSQTYALDVLAAILGHGRTSRLVRDLREDRGLVSHIGASNMTFQHQGIFYISAQCPVENIEIVENAILQHIRTLKNELVSKSEIARISSQVANRFVFANESPSDRAGLYGYYLSLIGALEPAFNYPSYIQGQNSIHLMEAAKKYLSSDTYGVVITKP
ncbi:MAG: insulinase family protein [Calothrix sp. C42_A2020_038]|nr:insulinase family protein [Calothrix sp. C42_A2020_038]